MAKEIGRVCDLSNTGILSDLVCMETAMERLYDRQSFLLSSISREG